MLMFGGLDTVGLICSLCCGGVIAQVLFAPFG